MSKVIVTDHPLIQHKLTIMRDKRNRIKGFQTVINRNNNVNGI